MTTMRYQSGVFSIGNFSSAKRYIRQVANPDDALLAMGEGPSISIAVVSGGRYGWRFECGALTKTNTFGETPQAAGFATDRLVAL